MLRTSPARKAARPANGRAAGALRPARDPLWPRVTRELADDLASDAVARDRAARPPHDEVARLREAGLPALLTAPGPARLGTDWRTACAVIREISAADSSIGELVARHYVLSWSHRFFGPADATASGTSYDTVHGSVRGTVRDACPAWLLGGDAGVGEPDAGVAGTALTPAAGGYVLRGRRVFAAGVGVVDRYVVGAPSTETGEILIVLVDPGHPGVLSAPVRDRLGQRLAGAGTVDFDDVPVERAQVIGTAARDEHAVSPAAALAPLALRLALAQVSLGIAEETLAEARDITRARPADSGSAFTGAAVTGSTVTGSTVTGPDAAGSLGAGPLGTGPLAAVPPTDGRPTDGQAAADRGAFGPAAGGPGAVDPIAFGPGAFSPPAIGPAAFGPGVFGLPERSGGDPYLLPVYGELATDAHAAAAVVDRATDAMARGLSAGRDVSMDTCADLSVLVAAAEAVTGRAAAHITARVLELTDRSGLPGAGDRSDGGAALDRFWRNARVLTAQSSVPHRLRDLGEHYLSGGQLPFVSRP